MAPFVFPSRKWTDVAQGLTGDTLNWSANGRYVYFDSPQEPYLGIFRFDVVKHRLETVVKFGSYREGSDLDVDISGFSLGPTSSVMLDAAVQSSRIYQLRLRP